MNYQLPIMYLKKFKSWICKIIAWYKPVSGMSPSNLSSIPSTWEVIPGLRVRSKLWKYVGLNTHTHKKTFQIYIWLEMLQNVYNLPLQVVITAHFKYKYSITLIHNWSFILKDTFYILNTILWSVYKFHFTFIQQIIIHYISGIRD